MNYIKFIDIKKEAKEKLDTKNLNGIIYRIDVNQCNIIFNSMSVHSSSISSHEFFLFNKHDAHTSVWSVSDTHLEQILMQRY